MDFGIKCMCSCVQSVCNTKNEEHSLMKGEIKFYEEVVTVQWILKNNDFYSASA